MRKGFKEIISLILSILMVFSLGAGSFAEGLSNIDLEEEVQVSSPIETDDENDTSTLEEAEIPEEEEASDEEVDRVEIEDEEEAAEEEEENSPEDLEEVPKLDISPKMEIIIEEGIILIKNSVKGLMEKDREFHIVITGPEDNKYIVSLKDGESISLENLQMGDYEIKPISTINYRVIDPATYISLSPDNSRQAINISYENNNLKWFSGTDSETFIYKPKDEDFIASNIEIPLKQEEGKEIDLIEDIEILDEEENPDTQDSSHKDEETNPSPIEEDSIEDENDEDERPNVPEEIPLFKEEDYLATNEKMEEKDGE